MTRIPYSSYAQFVGKAAILAHEIATGHEEACYLLALLSGYNNSGEIKETPGQPKILFYRAELINRLMLLRRDICHIRSSAIIDALDLPISDSETFTLSRFYRTRTSLPLESSVQKRI